MSFFLVNAEKNIVTKIVGTIEFQCRNIDRKRETVINF